MNQLDSGYDYPRYRKLLAEAVDEPKRLALIKLLIEERARDKLAEQTTQHSSDLIREIITPRDVPDAAERSEKSTSSLRLVHAQQPPLIARWMR